MVNLNELSSKDLAKILKYRQKIEVYEALIVKVLKEAKSKSPSVSSSFRNKYLPKNAQPTLRKMISGVLKKSGKPMSVAEIYEASLETGYIWRSKRPIRSLTVKMYTDDSFKKVGPGRFVLSHQSQK